jgi:hypothetical protein
VHDACDRLAAAAPSPTLPRKREREKEARSIAREFAPPRDEVAWIHMLRWSRLGGWSFPAQSRRALCHITPEYPTEVCAQTLRRRARNSAGRTRKVGRRPLGTNHAKVINVPNPRAADLQRSVKQKSQRAVQGEAASIMARWSRRLPRRALEGGTRDPSSSRNHIRPPLRDTDRACGRPSARLSALSYLVRGTTCI